MSFYLLDNPNPNGRFYYTRRKRCRHGYDKAHLIVLHSAENLPDFDPPDMGAESVARYASRTKRSVSWHVTVDSDSIINMLPSSYVGFHVRNYNTCSVGIEIATQHDAWLKAPETWLYRVYDNIADALWGLASELGIPLIDRRDDPSKWGVTTHAVLDPTRRKDPGDAFPFDWVLWMAKNGWRYNSAPVPPTNDPEPPPQPPAIRPVEPVKLAGPPSVDLLTMQDWARSIGGTDLFVALAQPAYMDSLNLGIDPAVPYAIMRHETNAGRFTGVLDVDFHNWGGIKTVAGGNDEDPAAHFRFTNHREGVRAVAEHVAAYAGIVVHEPVDPRFFLVRNKRVESIPDEGWVWAKRSHGPKVAEFVHEMREHGT